MAKHKKKSLAKHLRKKKKQKGEQLEIKRNVKEPHGRNGQDRK